ncbi:hypothetical protein RGQ29_033209 [Quercus rubra]|uniref:Uncharacterized protein n=1 Tax=Quercus rubra TaxID=3512 RepID=A0AAN7DU38_QUERU|nr:hypothetical protein RGQ29_033209 [Quercus rubra]KAK4542126.1 hypothetical protein RGQ29_033209 [Quercus rubra]KAK4542127.1 hypothetical protein RGQ29_033209 [Quercus rubra]
MSSRRCMRNLMLKKKVMEDMSMRSKLAKEDANKQEDQLSVQVRSLLVAGTALSVARKRLQESNRLLAGEKGYVRLRNLQKRLRMRQQYMISQVSLLYPVKISVGPAEEQELELFPSSIRSGSSAGSKPFNHGSLTILGLHLTMLPFKQMSFFTDKKEVQRSANCPGICCTCCFSYSFLLKSSFALPISLGWFSFIYY